MIKIPKTQCKTGIGTIAVSALVGGLAGAFVGLMLAPKSGKELRQGIQDTAHNRAGALKHQGSNIVDKGKQLTEDLQSFIQETLRFNKGAVTQLSVVQGTPPSETIEAPAEAESEETPVTVAENPKPILEE